MSFYDARGRSNYFIEFGQGRPILLLHGITNSGRSWGPQIPPLVEAGYRVVVPDHAGHGASARVTAPFGVGDLADDVETLLAQLKIETFDLVGLSLGGMVGLELGLRHPTRIGRLVIANSFDNTATLEFQALSEDWAKMFEQPNGVINRFEGYWPALVSPAFRATPEGMRTYQAWHGNAATSDGHSLANVTRGASKFDVSENIARLAMPTLFVSGSLDQMSPSMVSSQMAARAPRGHHTIIEGAAHVSNADSAAVFNARLLDFLQNPT